MDLQRDLSLASDQGTFAHYISGYMLNFKMSLTLVAITDSKNPKLFIALNQEAPATSAVYSFSNVHQTQSLPGRQFPFHGQVSTTSEMLISCRSKAWATKFRIVGTFSSCPWLHHEHQKHSDKETSIYFCVSESKCLSPNSSFLLKLSTRSSYQAGCASPPNCRVSKLPAALLACTKKQQNVMHLPGSPHEYPCAHAMAAHLSVCRWCITSSPSSSQGRRNTTRPSRTRQGDAICPDTSIFSIITPRTVLLTSDYYCCILLVFFPLMVPVI